MNDELIKKLKAKKLKNGSHKKTIEYISVK